MNLLKSIFGWAFIIVGMFLMLCIAIGIKEAIDEYIPEKPIEIRKDTLDFRKIPDTLRKGPIKYKELKPVPKDEKTKRAEEAMDEMGEEIIEYYKE